MALKSLSGAYLKILAAFNSVLAGADRTSMKGTDDSQVGSLESNLPISLGTGVSQAQQVYMDQRTLTASASELLNFSGGAAGGAVAIKNPHGQTITGTKLIGLVIQIVTADVGLAIGGDGTYDITTMKGANGDIENVPAGGSWAVAAGAADATGFAIATDEVLKVANPSGAKSVVYNIFALFMGTAA